ncbi:MAG: ABC transporter ATP-binding protein [Desertimonas sp.]
MSDGFYDGTLRTTVRLFGPRRAVLYASVGLRILNAACIGATAAVVLSVIRQLAEGSLDDGDVWTSTAVVVVAVIGQYLASYLANRFAWVATFEAIGEARIRTLRHLNRLPVGAVLDKRSGDVSAVLTSDFESVSNFAHHSLQAIFGAIALPVVVMIILVITDPPLAAAVAVSIVVAVPVFLLANRAFAALGLRRADELAVANTRMTEYVQGVGVARSFNQTGARLRWFREAVADVRAVNDAMAVKLVPLAIGAIGIVSLGIPLVVASAALRYFDGDVELAVVLAFLVLIVRVYAPLIEVATHVESLRLADASLQRIGRIMDIPEQPMPDHPAAVDPATAGTISFSGVTFGYRDRPVLHDVTFEVPAGTMTAIVGSSGAGKSTVLNLVARAWDVDDGIVRVGGTDVRDLTADQLFDLVTVVFQEVYLFQGTIRENIAFGDESATDEDVHRAARLAQADAFIEALPDGYDTEVGEGGQALSGGERQRVSIARAMLKRAPIVLLDEATASIDPINERAVQAGLAALVEDRTLLVVAHRLSTIRSADQILVMHDGRIAERGDHDTLLAAGGRYAELWRERARAASWRVGATSTVAAGQ